MVFLCPISYQFSSRIINSHNTLNAVVGHEVTHVLEGTEFYNELQRAVFDYARAKGELGNRWRSLKERYKGVDADINAELTADLVGDYLFTDSDFLARLSADNRNVFEQVFGEIKYLCRAATAGSQEARKLEKVKKAFGEAYRAETKRIAEVGVKYSLREFENRMQTSADAENDYKRWSKSIGINESAKTLAEFYNIKYNKPDEYELLKQYAKDVESGWISPLSGFENYKNIYNRIQNEIVGKTSANGIVITGQVPHFMQRVVGTMVDPDKLKYELQVIRRSGVDIDDISETLFHPESIDTLVKHSNGKTSVRFIGPKCIVTINPGEGLLIQTNPRKVKK